jgi:glyoxylase-like metal-dependent hydrolase (beta-lactamase superfamily II)
MTEEIFPGLYRIEIPLPQSPLKTLNSYVIKGPDRNLLIDTGFNRMECLEAMQAGLHELSVDLKKTDIFITHLHADHFGLVSKLIGPSCRVFFNRPEKELIESFEGFQVMIEFAEKNGFPKDQLGTVLSRHPANLYGSDWLPELSLLEDKDTIAYGPYHLQCVTTPGHTDGHICLYEPHYKFLLSGDHILADITPNIQCWLENRNPLQEYLKSLDKVSALEVDLVLPGHRRLIKDHRARIKALKDHHEIRLREILSILEEGPMNAFQIASQMTWDIVAESWDDFPVSQQWFATGEAISHLKYLEKEEKIIQEEEDTIIRYKLKSS